MRVGLLRLGVAGVLIVGGIVLIACSGATTSSINTSIDSAADDAVNAAVVDVGTNNELPTNDDVNPGELDATPTAEPDRQTVALEDLPSDSPNAKDAGRFETVGELPADVRANLLELAIESIDKKRTAKQLVAGDSRALKMGGCVYLTEGCEVLTIVGGRLQVMFEDSELVAFVENIKTSNLQSGNRIVLDLVEVVGVENYVSILGAGNNAFVLKAVSQGNWDRAVAYARTINQVGDRNAMRTERIELVERIKSLPADTWSAGEFSVEATFVSATDEQVTLKREDGREVTVDISRLDKSSQSRVLERRSQLSRWQRRIDQIDRLLESQK